MEKTCDFCFDYLPEGTTHRQVPLGDEGTQCEAVTELKLFSVTPFGGGFAITTTPNRKFMDAKGKFFAPCGMREHLMVKTFQTSSDAFAGLLSALPVTA